MNFPVVVSLGEVLWDLFPDGARFGGAPANFACHAAALDTRVSMISAVGDDAKGREAVAILRGYGIDVSTIERVSDLSTGSVGIILDESGIPTFEIHESAAWDRIAWSSEMESMVIEADAIYFSTLVQRGEISREMTRRVLDAAKGSRIPRVLDVNLRQPFFDNALIRESVERCSILKISDSELFEVTVACGVSGENDLEGVLRALVDRYELDLVALTRGPDGALIVSSNETIDQAGTPVKVADTVGAGDAFTARLVVGILRGENLRFVAKEACENAAFVCSKEGAVPAPLQSSRSIQL